MTLFFIIVALLVVAALFAIIPSALKSTSGDELNQLEANISIAKDRRAKLNNALAAGAIDQQTHDNELSDLENALAHDLSSEQQHRMSSKGGIAIAACIALFVPIAAGALYLQLGTPKAVDTQAMHGQAIAARNQQSNQPPAMAEALASLENKLAQDPENLDNWKLLGKTYLLVNDFPNAKRALQRALDMDANDPDVLAGLANATAMVNNGDLSGTPMEYIEQALTINPEHVQSLWLKAIAIQHAGRHKEAIDRFETLKKGVMDNPEAVANIDQLIEISAQALGSSENTSAAANTTETAQTQGASLSVTVSLSDDIVDKVNSTDTVFIFARASSGPPMPLAVSRHVVSDLPVTVVLDDTMAMMPAMTLSQFPSVTVGARVSRSGNAIAQPGDWFVEQDNVLPAEVNELSLIINKQK